MAQERKTNDMQQAGRQQELNAHPSELTPIFTPCVQGHIART